MCVCICTYKYLHTHRLIFGVSFILKNINVYSNKSESVEQIGELEITGRVDVSMLSSKSNWRQKSSCLARCVYPLKTFT